MFQLLTINETTTGENNRTAADRPGFPVPAVPGVLLGRFVNPLNITPKATLFPSSLSLSFIVFTLFILSLILCCASCFIMLCYCVI